MTCPIKIENIDQAKAMLCFLCAECNRHGDDIMEIQKDIYRLAKEWGIEEIPWDNTYFVRVR